MDFFMSQLKYFDRVRETTNTTGTGTLILQGSPAGFRPFSLMNNGDQCLYLLEEKNTNEWEIGIGTYFSDTLSRDNISSSSNNGNRISLSSGTHVVSMVVASAIIQQLENLINDVSDRKNISSSDLNDISTDFDIFSQNIQETINSSTSLPLPDTISRRDFFGRMSVGFASDNLDAVNLEYFTQYLPTGLIAMWDGSSPPSGWVLCDGSNGTPDLRDRFIVASGNNYSVGDTGGSSTNTTGNSGFHFHNFSYSIGNHTLNVSRMPGHSHTHSRTLQQSSSIGGGNRTAVRPGGTNTYIGIRNTGGSFPHSHSISGVIGTSGLHSHTVSSNPPYYAMTFIMLVNTG